MEASISADSAVAESTGAGSEHTTRRSLLRAFNDDLAKVTGSARLGVTVLVCECGSEDCSESLAVDRAQYEAVSTYPARFLVAPGHENGERVLARNNRAVLIEVDLGPQTPDDDADGDGDGEGLGKKRIRRVLVVDDDASIRMLCAINLEAAGFSVLEASDGYEGLERARSERPDLVLTDVAMPRLDGFGLVEALRQHEQTRAIPVAFMTGYPEERYGSRARDLGALAFLKKPFEPATLVSVAMRAFV